jgi:hypothetical protein
VEVVVVGAAIAERLVGVTVHEPNPTSLDEPGSGASGKKKGHQAKPYKRNHHPHPLSVSSLFVSHHKLPHLFD